MLTMLTRFSAGFRACDTFEQDIALPITTKIKMSRVNSAGTFSI